jgi:lysylphosphatidylglycerol synthetase-like protein (DUF2156 family)
MTKLSTFSIFIGTGLLTFAFVILAVFFASSEVLWWQVGFTEEEMQQGVHGGIALAAIPVVVYSLMFSVPPALASAILAGRWSYSFATNRIVGRN